MSTALLLLRAAQLGIPVSDLDTLSVGMLLDMYTEALNDQEEYPVLADQEDYDRF